MLLAIALIAAGAGGFGGQLGLAEQSRIAVSFAAPLARVLAVLVVTVLIAAALSREAADRSRQIALAAALSRSGWILAKWASFVVMAVATALACGLTLLLLASSGMLPAEPTHATTAAAILAWTASLALELAIVASIATAVSLSIGQVAPSILATLAVYCASRVIGVILLLSAHAPLGREHAAATPLDWLLQLLGLLLPRLDGFARTDWLAGAPLDAFAPQLLQAGLYCALMLAVSIFDFSRQEL